MTPPAPSPPSVPFALPVSRTEDENHWYVTDATEERIAQCDWPEDADAIVRAINAFYCPSAQATERE